MISCVISSIFIAVNRIDDDDSQKRKTFGSAPNLFASSWRHLSSLPKFTNSDLYKFSFIYSGTLIIRTEEDTSSKKKTIDISSQRKEHQGTDIFPYDLWWHSLRLRLSDSTVVSHSYKKSHYTENIRVNYNIIYTTLFILWIAFPSSAITLSINDTHR